jgi:hypothetical protein
MPGPYRYDYEIGLTAGSMVNLADLGAAPGVSYPKSSPMFFAQTTTLADNTERGIGLPVTVWHWTVLPQEMRDQLRAFCPGASATVYIRTRALDANSTFHIYQAVMVWPSQSEIYDARYRTDFTIEFRQMVFQSDPAPTITTIVPDTGDEAGGTTVLITGTYLSTTTAVTFDGVNAAIFTVLSDSQISAVTPAHATGAVDVAVTASGGTATASGGFTYTGSM